MKLTFLLQLTNEHTAHTEHTEHTGYTETTETIETTENTLNKCRNLLTYYLHFDSDSLISYYLLIHLPTEYLPIGQIPKIKRQLTS